MSVILSRNKQTIYHKKKFAMPYHFDFQEFYYHHIIDYNSHDNTIRLYTTSVKHTQFLTSECMSDSNYVLLLYLLYRELQFDYIIPMY